MNVTIYDIDFHEAGEFHTRYCDIGWKALTLLRMHSEYNSINYRKLW